jgi:hypothetical protein
MVFTVSTTADSNCYAVHISPTAASGVSQRQDIVKLARLLEKLPHDNHKTVQSVATQVQVSLERVDAEAASTSRKIAATLQCTGWLLQAAQGIPQPARGSALAAQVMAQHTAQLCFMAARNALEQSNPPGMDLEVLQVVMQPAPGSRIPGGLSQNPMCSHTQRHTSTFLVCDCHLHQAMMQLNHQLLLDKVIGRLCLHMTRAFDVCAKWLRSSILVFSVILYW